MRVLLLLIVSLCFFTLQPLQAKENLSEVYIPNIFIYEIPEEAETEDEIGSVKLNTNVNTNSSTVLKSEIKYFDNLDIVTLDNNPKSKSINLAKPQKIQSASLKDYNKKALNAKTVKHNSQIVRAKYQGIEEDIVTSKSAKYEERYGNFLFGSNYSSDVNSLSSLDYSSGLFSRYKKKNFAISTGFYRDQSAVSDWYSNSFSFAPELRLNRSLAVKNVMKADITNNRRSNELVLMLTPFAYKGDDRFNLELGAGQTYDDSNALLKSKFRFSTNLKL